MNTPVLELDKITFSFNKKTNTIDKLSMSLEEGKIGCLLGPSGCGKTTLLRIIAGFERVQSGSVRIRGQVVNSQKEFIAPEKRSIGLVFQDYALFPHLSVRDNIAFGLRKTDFKKNRVDEMLKVIDLSELADRYPSELSGGQQQRVALARALAPQPSLLLLDEPFSNLDPKLRDRMKIELRRMLLHFKVTAILVTHNQDEAFDIADEIGVMSKGHLLQWGNAYDLYHKPLTKTVAEFLGMGAFLPATVSEDGCLHSELGELVCKEDLKNLNGQKLLVLLRPDDIVHDDESPIFAELTAIAFRGMYQVYYLRLSSGLEIHCFTSSHHHEHPIGSRIGIRLDMKHAVILREDDRALIENVDENPHHPE